jgi:hypothetical protein
LANLSSITRWIKGHRAGFRKLHPSRQVNNLYFETHDYFSYGENIAGISRRMKTRLRWYGSSELSLLSPVLEIKNRSNKQGWKTTFPLGNIELSNRWKELSLSISQQLPIEGRLVFQSFPFATLINRYDRDYYMSSDNRLRITVDKHIQVFDQRNTMCPKFKPRINLPDYLIVEFKYHHDDINSVSDIIRDFPLRPSRSSKYVTGLKAIVEAV